jgi:hypothetical protein
VTINNNCFANPKSDYEVATSLMEHAKIVDASQNNFVSFWANFKMNYKLNKIWWMADNVEISLKFTLN